MTPQEQKIAKLQVQNATQLATIERERRKRAEAQRDKAQAERDRDRACSERNKLVIRCRQLEQQLKDAHHDAVFGEVK
jgi:hypothetical protein